LAGRKTRSSKGTETLHPQEIATVCARIADNKKAENILIYDVRKVTFITDFFVICSGYNKRQLQSIANDIELELHKRHIDPLGIEGYTDAQWILIDCGDVIVHLFDKDKRHFYDIDLLWGDTPKLRWHADAERHAAP